VATWAAEAERPQPKAKATPRPTARVVKRQRRVAGGVVWIGIVAALLAGVVAMNVAVLRLNMQLDRLGREGPTSGRRTRPSPRSSRARHRRRVSRASPPSGSGSCRRRRIRPPTWRCRT